MLEVPVEAIERPLWSLPGRGDRSALKLALSLSRPVSVLWVKGDRVLACPVAPVCLLTVILEAHLSLDHIRPSIVAVYGCPVIGASSPGPTSTQGIRRRPMGRAPASATMAQPGRAAVPCWAARAHASPAPPPRNKHHDRAHPASPPLSAGELCPWPSSAAVHPSATLRTVTIRSSAALLPQAPLFLSSSLDHLRCSSRRDPRDFALVQQVKEPRASVRLIRGGLQITILAHVDNTMACSR
jgi:hypothetical protein